MEPISVCFPYWNRLRELRRSMKAYAEVYPDLELEFSICDDGSIVPLEERQANWKVTRLPRHLNALNPCVPINVAVRQASHDVIVLTNPEIEHRTPVFQQMFAALQGPDDYVSATCHDPEIGIIAGEGTPLAPIGGRGPVPRGSDVHFCVMMRKELFLRAGGFDESYRQGAGWDDNDFLWRAHAVGAQFKRVPGIVHHTRTPHPWTQRVDNAALFAKKWPKEKWQACV